MDLEFLVRRYMLSKVQKTWFQKEVGPIKVNQANNFRLRRGQCHWVRPKKSKKFHVLHFSIRCHMKKLWDPKGWTKKLNQSKKVATYPTHGWPTQWQCLNDMWYVARERGGTANWHGWVMIGAVKGPYYHRNKTKRGEDCTWVQKSSMGISSIKVWLNFLDRTWSRSFTQ